MNKAVPIVTIFFLVGCYSHSTQGHYPAARAITPSKTVSLSNEAEAKRLLYLQLNEWKAVKYKLGGLNKDGIDCSGFVYLTYVSKFGIELPRSTEQQASIGRNVSQRDLKPGDLVFFKTGFSTRHVGIFLEGRNFVHASKSSGVAMSSLDNEYWSKKYWKAMRVRA